MPLRRLTKFSRLELEKEQAELERDDRGARRDPRRRGAAARRWSPTSSAEVAKTLRHPAAHGAARVGRAARSPRPMPLEVADDPCFVYLSSAGLLARTTDTEPPPATAAAGPSTTSSSPRSAPPPAARSARSPRAGRLVRLERARPADAAGDRERTRTSRAARRSSEFLSLEPGERVLRAVRARRRTAPGLALGTRQRRRQAGQPRGARQPRRLGGDPARRRRRAWSAPSSCAPATRSSCFITTDAQLLHFPRAGGAPAGPLRRWHGRRSGSPPGSARSCRSARSTRRRRGRGDRRRARARRCPAPRPGAVKVTPFAEYPAKGRATGGVRCHRFLKGEDALVLAWAGAGTGPGRRGQRRRRSTCPTRPAGGTARAHRRSSRWRGRRAGARCGGRLREGCSREAAEAVPVGSARRAPRVPRPALSRAAAETTAPGAAAAHRHRCSPVRRAARRDQGRRAQAFHEVAAQGGGRSPRAPAGSAPTSRRSTAVSRCW